MDRLLLIKPLDIDEIDFRIQSINKGGYATILAYKNARVDMNRLDAAVGVGFWQRKHDLINGALFCSVGVYNKELKEWVWVQDVGVESYTEKTKGQASDSFKRACFNLGIGRELYDYPAIQVKLNPDEFELYTTKVNGRDVEKAKATFNLKLKQWNWASQFTNGELTFLYCTDDKAKKRFLFGKYVKPKSKTK